MVPFKPPCLGITVNALHLNHFQRLKLNIGFNEEPPTWPKANNVQDVIICVPMVMGLRPRRFVISTIPCAGPHLPEACANLIYSKAPPLAVKNVKQIVPIAA